VNSRLTQKIWQRLEEVDTSKLDALMAKGDYIATWKFVEEQILGMK
jgi:hypothetical protein